MLFLLRNAHNCLHVRGVYFDDQSTDEVPAAFEEVFVFMDFCDTQLVQIQCDMSENDISEVLRGIANGISEIHAFGVGHFDLKLENIVIQGPVLEENIKICDFGSSSTTKYTHDEIIQQNLISSLKDFAEANTTPQYRAPELIDFYKFGVCEKADIFSFGVIAYRLITGRVPFPDGELLANYNCRWSVDDSVPKHL